MEELEEAAFLPEKCPAKGFTAEPVDVCGQDHPNRHLASPPGKRSSLGPRPEEKHFCGNLYCWVENT